MKTTIQLYKIQTCWWLGVIHAQAGIQWLANLFVLSDIRRNAVKRPKATLLLIRACLLFCLLPLLNGCMSIVYYEGSYDGKVIDSKTLQPIEGAVVLGVWYKEYHTAGGVVREFYDSRETLTDIDGEFTIKGMGAKAMTYLGNMYVVIFKAGFEDVSLTSWESLKTAIYYRDRVKWQDRKAIIPLDKWNIEQQRKRYSVRVTGLSDEKQEMLLKAIKREENEIK